MENGNSTLETYEKRIPKSNSFQSVHNVLDIFELLSEKSAEASLTELANATGIHKSTALRLMRPLVQRGYIIRDDSTKNYRLGLKLLTVANAMLNDSDLRTYAKSYMTELANFTKETVHLATIQDFEVVYLDKIDTSRSLIMRSKIGLHAPMYCTGLGKAMLSRMNEKDLSTFLDRSTFLKFTKNTIIDKGKLNEELAAARNRGYAIDNEEHEYGIKCVAAPILGRDGTIAGAMSIAAPSREMNNARISEYGKLISDYAKNISIMLGNKCDR